MADRFADLADNIGAPARRAFAITPHDVNALADIPKAIFVGTGGTVILRAIDGEADVTLKNVASGQTLDIRARYVRATGTTAADLVGLA